MTQKVLKVGTSLAVTIPKETAKRLKLHAGDSVDVTSKGEALIIRASEKIDPELVHWTDSFIAQYESALKALSKK